MGGSPGGPGSKPGKVNDVVEDANWRQRINAETEAAECWRHEWGFLLSQNGDAGLDNSFTERARAKMKEMEAVQAGRDDEMDASAAAEKANELFLKTFKKKHKEFPKGKPQEAFPRPVLTSHEYGWDGGTLERFGRLTCKLR